MPWKLPRPRFGLRALLLVVLACAIGLAFWTSPGRWRTYRNQQARQRIDPYELSIAGDGNPKSVPPELVAILGDSRLKHWGLVGPLRILAGNRLASHGWDERLRVWDIDTGHQLLATEAINFTVSGNRQTIFFATVDGTISQVDAKTLKVVRTLPPIDGFDRFNLATNKDGTILACEASNADRMREITIWDTSQTRAIHTFRPPKPGGGALAVSSDGKLFTWEDAGQFHVAETVTGKVLQTCGPIKDASTAGGSYMLGNIAFSADDSKLFVGSARMELTVFDRYTGEAIEWIGPTNSGAHVFAVGASENFLFVPQQEFLRVFARGGEWRVYRDLAAHRPGLANVDWAHSLTAASHREGGISLWSGAVVPDIPWRLPGGPETDVSCLAFHPDGWLVTGDSQGEMSCWEPGTWERQRHWRAHRGLVLTVGISRNGAKLVSTAEDGIAVWNPDTAQEMLALHNIRLSRFAALSADGSQLASNTDEFVSKACAIHNTATGAAVKRLGPLRSSLYGIPAWSPDGTKIVCNDMSSNLEAFDVASGALIGTLGKGRYAQCEIRAVWLSDSKRLVTAGWGRDEVHFLEIGKTTPVMTLNAGSGRVKWVALHPSEKWIATCGEKTPVQIWHLPTGKSVKSWQIGPLKGVVHQVEFSPDGNYLATVNGNGTAYILSLDGVLSE